MLNYVNAELYKLRHKRGLLIGTGALMILESTLLLPGLWKELDGAQVEVLLGFLVVLFPVGLFAAPIFAAAVFDDQYGHATLKNEVVFGIPRSRIYLGKLLAAMLAGTLAAVLVVGWYVIIAAILARDISGVSAEIWICVGAAAAGAWMTWLAAVAFTFFLLFVLKSVSGALASVYLLTMFGLPLCMIGYQQEPGRFDLFYWFSRLFYIAPYRRILEAPSVIMGQTMTPLFQALGESAAICLGWVTVTAALGLAVFSRREVK